jgi:hypothetical protein
MRNAHRILIGTPEEVTWETTAYIKINIKDKGHENVGWRYMA